LLSQQAHQPAAQGEAIEEELHRVDEQLGRKAAELWKLTKGELDQIQASLRQIR